MQILLYFTALLRCLDTLRYPRSGFYYAVPRGTWDRGGWLKREMSSPSRV